MVGMVVLPAGSIVDLASGKIMIAKGTLQPCCNHRFFGVAQRSATIAQPLRNRGATIRNYLKRSPLQPLQRVSIDTRAWLLHPI